MLTHETVIEMFRFAPSVATTCLKRSHTKLASTLTNMDVAVEDCWGTRLRSVPGLRFEFGDDDISVTTEPSLF